MHILSGFAYLVVCSDQNRTFKPIVNGGPDVVQELSTESETINKTLKSKATSINITAEEKRASKSTENCYFCDISMGVDRVKNHDNPVDCFKKSSTQ